MDSVTQRNATQTEELTATATQVKTVAQELNQAVSYFRIDAASAARRPASSPPARASQAPRGAAPRRSAPRASAPAGFQALPSAPAAPQPTHDYQEF
jgi:methyl-accepting chemotaxis protein